MTSAVPPALRAVEIRADGLSLEGDLAVPHDAVGLVVFAHGSGSSRRSPRNRAVAEELGASGLATLLFDLLTPEEGQIDLVTRQLRFDIPRLARRVVGVVDWVRRAELAGSLPLGLFGSSTGAAAALVAAAIRPEEVGAVVSRGGRPDLAGPALDRVEAPTLLIVGQLDPQVIRLNEQARARMRAPVRLEVVPGATHLFEEPGTLQQVSRLAAAFFAVRLAEAGLSGQPEG